MALYNWIVLLLIIIIIIFCYIAENVVFLSEMVDCFCRVSFMTFWRICFTFYVFYSYCAVHCMVCRRLWETFVCHSVVRGEERVGSLDELSLRPILNSLELFPTRSQSKAVSQRVSDSQKYYYLSVCFRGGTMWCFLTMLTAYKIRKSLVFVIQYSSKTMKVHNSNKINSNNNNNNNNNNNTTTNNNNTKMNKKQNDK